MTSRSLIVKLLFLVALFSGGCCSNNCSGRKVLNGQEGYISDGPDMYKANSHCEWLIDAGSTNKTIHLTFETMATECSFDFLFIYDGNSYNSRLIATLSGDSPPKSLTAYSGYMLLYLFSDRNYLKMGFEARYKIYDCPWNCSNQASCINHTCHCRAGFSGEACEVKNCPSNCGEHGSCKFHSYKLQYCHCDEGYIGWTCGLQINGAEGQAQWHTVQLDGKKFPPRTAHTSVFANDCIWVFGGFDLNDVLDDLKRYCMKNNTWESLEIPLDSGTNATNLWPAGRSGHAMDSYGDGFFIFAGALKDGSHSNELWFFNITSEKWTLCATESEIKPEKITGHTLTTAEDYLYVLGGKNEDRIFVTTMFRISAKNPDQWEQVLIRGGNYPPKRLVGHTTVYYKHSRSLIVFGGYTQGSALFSDRGKDIQAFNIDDHYWAHLYNVGWKKDSMPRHRAFHSGVLMGNYLVIYGGNTHDHSGLEICYSQEIFFYHLGCHVWLNHTHFTGNVSSNGMPSKGRFGHTAVVANGNVMFVIGGYSGQVLGDLLAYKVPSAIADFECSSNNKSNCSAKPAAENDADHCEEYPNSNNHVCQDDPECVFCNQGRVDKGNQSCVHKTRIELCVSGDFHDSADRCPGICPALHTCGTCVTQGKGVEVDAKLPRRRTYVRECSWCVKEAQCQTHSVPFGTCQSPIQTESGIQGWWGGLSANITSLVQCQIEDIPAGLHWVKFRDPQNSSFPDEVSIIRKTQGNMGYIITKLTESAYVYTSKFLGFIHPLNASVPTGENLTLFLGLKNAKALLNLSLDEADSLKETVIMVGEATKYNTIQASRKSGLPVFPSIARGHKYFIELLTEQTRATTSHPIPAEQATITLGWNSGLHQSSKQHVITSEFLEPYSNGSCNTSYNCLACLTDVLCSWCEVKRECMPRNISEDSCQDEHQQNYPITSPSECPNCEHYVECSVCAGNPLCEWVIDSGHCTRRLRTPHGAVTDNNKCKPPCHQRKNCTDCITEKAGCAWCENTHTCLPFSDYVTRYIYGQCTAWVDSSGLDLGCHSCSSYSTCGTCLTEFGCGWCSNNHNPRYGLCLDGDFNDPQVRITGEHCSPTELAQPGIEPGSWPCSDPIKCCSNNYNPRYGLCIDGDFNGMYGKQTCSGLLGKIYNLSVTEPSSWSYDVCPDVEECSLGIHDCHANATCINVYASYKCECNRGFEGDGKMRCDETCYHPCFNGKCSGPPEFKCECDLGWANHSCDVDCGCNNHSTCGAGVGVCDSCQHRTAGTTCNECMPGSYGNPLDSHGCLACSCNGHGDASLGECDNKTGECFCTGNTQGIYCEHCRQGYYGNPRDGGRCYLKCDHRVFVTNVTEGALGSHRGTGVERPEHAYCLWVLTVFADIQHVPTDSETVPTLAMTMEGDMAIECGQDAVHVYSGIPDFIYGSNSGPSESLGEFCGMNPGRDVTIYGTSGTITVFFEGDLLRSLSRGFNATFKAHACPDRCHENHMCADGSCVCKEGYWGQSCQLPICPFNCSKKLNQGYCLNGLCVCNPGFSGVGCEGKTDNSDYKDMRLQILTDARLANSPIGGPTLKKFGTYPEFISSAEAFGPSPRSGHTLTTCGEGLMFLFGGHSHHHGILSDMWMFNVSSKMWTHLLPATDQSPSGRYHHAAACIPLLKMIFVFGGFEELEIDTWTMTRTVRPTNKLWKFNIESHAWTWDQFQSPSWLPALAGHTLTHVGSTNLMLVGGFSSENYFNDKVFEYNVSNGLVAWQEHSRGDMSGSIPIGIYGHSAVYDHFTQTIYIYGGYLFRSDQWYVSRELFTLDARVKKWNMLYPYMHSDWESRVFHTAVHVGDAMVVIGGLTISGSYAKDVLVYRYACNTWHRLKFNDFEQEQVNTAVVGLDAVSLGSVVYLFGGFAGVMLGTLSQLVLPADVCALITDSVVCSNISGCQMCVQTLETGENVTVCYNSHRTNNTRPSRCVGPSPDDKRCNLRNYLRRDCQHYTTCSQCLAVHPYFKEHVKDEEPSCVWCANCPMGSCVPNGQQCPTQKPCPLNQDIIMHVQQCFEYMCPASDCDKCEKLGYCLWTRHFQRSSEIGRYFNSKAIYNWNCITNNMKLSTNSKFQSMPPDSCLARCYTFTTCESCLSSPGSEGGSKKCVWSEVLQECMPPAYLPLRCTLGECHFLRFDNLASCPERCDTHKTCAACINSPECGWCAFGGMNGKGVCMAGAITGPTQGGVCSEGNFSVSIPFIDVIAEVKGKPELLTSHTANPTWSFDKCQPENECMNQHHTCNPDTQECIDTLEHFRCECKRGYIMNVGSNKCEPVCHQGCVHGVCVKPDECHCDFGWVGSNCSVECQCNKHSNCKSVLENNKCLKCENNTMGDKCQFCKIMFVGNPVNGGQCVPCLEFCNNHTEICMTQAEYDLSLEVNFDLHKIHNNHPSTYYYSLLRQGPKKEDAVCIMCQHNTTGRQCDTCTSGHFRKLHEHKTKSCRECHCNGHSNVCHVDTGESCQCRNNTETNCESKDEADCWEYQCAQCKEYFLGTPTNGHQCYRQMNVDRDYCFDPETQNNCNQFPKALKMGRTVFFAVQPKYLNVDIRITIDVTMGSADVFISNKKDTFQVFVDNKSWLHNIYLDKMYASGRAGLARRSIMGNVNIGDLDDEAIREKLQLHESGSVRISESVPDYLKLKEGDTEFYKMTQFESIEKADAKARGKGKWNKQKDNGTDDMETQSDEVDGSSGYEDVAEDDHDEDTKKEKKKNPSSNIYQKKTRKLHPVANGAKSKTDMHVLFVENIVEFFDTVDQKTGVVNETVLQKYLARHKNLTASKKRYRRGITVTDSKKESKVNGVASGIKMGEIDAGELNTYITVGQQNSVLVVRDVRFRLVITLPRDQHDLRSSRFYIIVRSRGGNAENVTYGNLYFRQDQPHIDLFVFFSVFFSCFFLFLAVCVMLWKMKQTFDARRSRQMREREMECMASRPFARILVLIEHDEQVYFSLSSGLVRPRSRLGRQQNRNQYYNNNDINAVSILPQPRELGVLPIAIEPTEDGQAGVGTVLFQLPGGATAPSHLCLGSALTMRIITPAVTQKSSNLRRRTSASSC